MFDVLFLNSLFRDHVTNERFKSVDYTKQSSRQCLAEDWSWDEPPSQVQEVLIWQGGQVWNVEDTGTSH